MGSRVFDRRRGVYHRNEADAAGRNVGRRPENLPNFRHRHQRKSPALRSRRRRVSGRSAAGLPCGNISTGYFTKRKDGVRCRSTRTSATASFCQAKRPYRSALFEGRFIISANLFIYLEAEAQEKCLRLFIMRLIPRAFIHGQSPNLGWAAAIRCLNPWETEKPPLQARCGGNRPGPADKITLAVYGRFQGQRNEPWFLAASFGKRSVQNHRPPS